MSEFLMIVPEGWTEIPNPDQILTEESWISSSPWEVTAIAVELGVIEDDNLVRVVAHRVFRDGDVLRVWVLIESEG